ncbi:hypothetical protein [Aquimarina agarilytica]|uniref:hypothetical protein n=1 Tax=Aquimarina agarilytica TaxID=1087449 RepID=UPI0012F7CCAC|nr:hypothetical protein [Aquimarina agarilytica]
MVNSEWLDYSNFTDKSNDYLRNTIIHNLSIKTNESVSYLQSQSNYELSQWSALYHFFKESSIINEQDLLGMTMRDLKSRLIKENNSILKIQSKNYSINELVRLGYEWYLPRAYNNLINPSNGILSQANENSKFKLVVPRTDDYKTRNSVISHLMNSTAETDVSHLQKQSDEILAEWKNLYYFIKLSKVRNSNEISNMTIKSLINTLKVENSKRLNDITINNQINLPISDLISLGKRWYTSSDLDNEIKLLVNEKLYDEMHVVKIVETGESGDRYKYLAVYHISSDPDNNTDTDDHNLQLAGSNNLFDWEHIIEIEDNGHQGDIIKWGNGYLIAYEDDHDHGTNHVAIKYYDSYDHIINENATFERVMPHTIKNSGNRLVEGTPDIRKVTGNSPYDGSILIGFHYFDGVVDRLAMGVYKNDNWKAWKDVTSEYNLRKMNFHHNIGSRKGFMYNGKLLTLQEARRNEKWNSWRIMLGLNGYYTKIHITTPSHISDPENPSVSFANPSIIPIENNQYQYAITLFLPTEGNHPSENNGGMIYLK